MSRRTVDFTWLSSIPDDAVVSVDTETTGTNRDKDEILQVALVRGNGEVLMNELVEPERRTSWCGAQRVHGIAPQDVENARSMHELTPEVDRIMSQAQLVVGYNLPFDMGFLERAGVARPCCPLFDVMRAFAPIANVRRADGSLKWQSLEACARYYGVGFSPHDALEDARATLLCFKVLLADEMRRRDGAGS